MHTLYTRFVKLMLNTVIISECQCIAHMHTHYTRLVKLMLNTVIISERQCINTKLAGLIPHGYQILTLVLAF